MKDIKNISGGNLSWIGIGTYGIGGRGHRDLALTEKKSDKVYLDALLHQFQTGYNFTEIALGYGHGNACRLFTKAMSLSNIDRKELFITNSVYPRDFGSFDEVKEDIDKMYTIFNTDYFDSTLVTQSLTVKYGYKKVITLLHSLLKSKKTRYVSLSNAGKKCIKKFKKEFGSKFFAHETHLSFEVRINQDAKVFDTCDKLGVENIIWRPLRRNKTVDYSWGLLVKLAQKYNRSQNQIILNWISHLGYRPMVMSSSKAHIDENWNANNFVMDAEEYNKINTFRVPGFTVPEIDWEKQGKGIGMADFSVYFDEYYKKFKKKKAKR